MEIQDLDKPFKTLGLDKAPTLRDILSESVGRTAAAANPREVMRIYRLTDKIMEAKGTLDLDGMEYDYVRECVEKNPAKFFPFYLGQALERLAPAVV
jgi:hypothetical protein